MSEAKPQLLSLDALADHVRRPFAAGRWRAGADRGGSSEGFTLIELLIVIAIILLLTVLLIPSFIGFLSGRKLRSGAAKIDSMLQRAKSEAIKSRRMHYVVFDKYNHRLGLVDAGINGRSEFQSVEEDGEIRYASSTDDRLIILTPDQRSLPAGCFLARSTESEDDLLFSQTVLCYPDGSMVTSGRSDVSTVTYLDGAGSRGLKGGDIVLTLGEWDGTEMKPLLGPPEGEGDERRGCFMDITPTVGRVRYEIDTWKRDYNK